MVARITPQAEVIEVPVLKNGQPTDARYTLLLQPDGAEYVVYGHFNHRPQPIGTLKAQDDQWVTAVFNLVSLPGTKESVLTKLANIN